MRILILALFTSLAALPVNAETRSLVTGRNPQEIQENAFKDGMNYPVGPLRCDQRCSQWWARE